MTARTEHSSQSAPQPVVCPQCAQGFLAPSAPPEALIECPRCGARAPHARLLEFPDPPSTHPRPNRLLLALTAGGLLAIGGLWVVALSLQQLRPAHPSAATESTRSHQDPALPPPEMVEAALAVATEALASPDWQSASRSLLDADRLATTISQYHARHAWTPIALGAVLDARLIRQNSVDTLRLSVHSERGQPLILHLQHTPEGWKLDWERLVDARHFAWREFHENPPSSPVLLEVLALRGSAAAAHFAAAGLTAENGLAVRLDGPRPGLPVIAIVPKASDLGRLLHRELTWEHPRAYRCQLRMIHPDSVPPQVEITQFSGESWIQD